MGNLLRTGVVLAALVVFVGGCLYLAQYGHATTDYGKFHSEPASLKTLPGITSEFIALHSKGVIQLGVLLLIATPIMRVIFAVLGFALERDLLYTTVSLVVLAVLMYSLLGHAM
jgi:uncharacterized membrane protein